VQNLQQLHLLNFNSKKIKTNASAKQECLEMANRALTKKIPFWYRSNSEILKVCTLNIRSLRKHIPDLRVDKIMTESDIICLSETHLTETVMENNDLTLNGFNMHHISPGRGKGVAVLFKNYLGQPKKVIEINDPLFQILFLIFEKFQITVIYRSQSPISNLKKIYNILHDYLDFEKSLLICGDINIPYNLQPKNYLSRKLKNNDIYQYANCVTHKSGNILDHLYCHKEDFYHMFVHAVYYSDHEAQCIAFFIDNDKE
jgi:exonuclease III